MNPPNGSPRQPPRHLHDLTAEMPAVRQPPRHAAPPTDEQPIWRPKPPVPDPVDDTERRQPGSPRRSNISSVGWWERFKRWLNGGEQWK